MLYTESGTDSKKCQTIDRPFSKPQSISKKPMKITSSRQFYSLPRILPSSSKPKKSRFPFFTRRKSEEASKPQKLSQKENFSPEMHNKFWWDDNYDYNGLENNFETGPTCRSNRSSCERSVGEFFVEDHSKFGSKKSEPIKKVHKIEIRIERPEDKRKSSEQSIRRSHSMTAYDNLRIENKPKLLFSPLKTYCVMSKPETDSKICSNRAPDSFFHLVDVNMEDFSTPKSEKKVYNIPIERRDENMSSFDRENVIYIEPGGFSVSLEKCRQLTWPRRKRRAKSEGNENHGNSEAKKVYTQVPSTLPSNINNTTPIHYTKSLHRTPKLAPFEAKYLSDRHKPKSNTKLIKIDVQTNNTTDSKLVEPPHSRIFASNSLNRNRIRKPETTHDNRLYSSSLNRRPKNQPYQEFPISIISSKPISSDSFIPSDLQNPPFRDPTYIGHRTKVLLDSKTTNFPSKTQHSNTSNTVEPSLSKKNRPENPYSKTFIESPESFWKPEATDNTFLPPIASPRKKRRNKILNLPETEEIVEKLPKNKDPRLVWLKHRSQYILNSPSLSTDMENNIMHNNIKQSVPAHNNNAINNSVDSRTCERAQSGQIVGTQKIMMEIDNLPPSSSSDSNSSSFSENVQQKYQLFNSDGEVSSDEFVFQSFPRDNNDGEKISQIQHIKGMFFWEICRNFGKF